eukprot:6501326-Heterocapsa_arctica.AAC.1
MLDLQDLARAWKPELGEALTREGADNVHNALIIVGCQVNYCHRQPCACQNKCQSCPNLASNYD